MRDRNRILIVASLFPPAQSAGVFRTLRFSRYLSRVGWDVTVLTVDEDFYEETQAKDQRLKDKISCELAVVATRAVYPVESLSRMKQVLTLRRNNRIRNGANCDQETARTAHGGPTTIARLKDAITLPLMTPDRLVGWVPFAVRAGTAAVRRQSIDVLYSTGPPFSNHVVGLKLKRKIGLPWVADFRDPWVSADFRPIRRSNTWVGRRHQKLETLVAREADRLLFTTPEIRDDMLQRHPDLASQKCHVLYNGFDPEDYRHLQVCHDTPRHGRPLVMAHAGSFYGKRTVEPLLRAIGRLKSAGQLTASDIRLELIGAGVSGRTVEVQKAREYGIEELVEVTPPIDHQSCLERLAAADVLLLVQTEAPMCIPGKVFEYIALRKPVFTLCDRGATARFVREERLGWCVRPDDPEGLDNTLLELIHGFRAGEPLPVPSEEALARFDSREQTRELADLFSTLLSSTR